jgi:hypothetical protein
VACGQDEDPICSFIDQIRHETGTNFSFVTAEMQSNTTGATSTVGLGEGYRTAPMNSYSFRSEERRRRIFR